MKLRCYYMILVSGILFSLISGCSLSENKAKNIINDKLSRKKNIIHLKIRGYKAEKAFKYLTENNYIENTPSKTSATGDKQYKITPDNDILYHADNTHISTTRDADTGKMVIMLPLRIHERVKKITTMTNHPNGQKVIIKYTGYYTIIKSNDQIWNWCLATETCSRPLSNYLNDEYTAEITLVKGDHGWE